MSSDKRVSEIASIANRAFYNSENTQDYLEVAPHIKHPSLRSLYSELVLEVNDAAAVHGIPRVLDIGAGEGSATMPFLQLGSRVTAIDISKEMLEALQRKCSGYGPDLEIICSDVFEALRSLRHDGRLFDIVIASSFLHHVPDYLGLIRDVIPLLSDHGQFFSFQDPLRFDSVGRVTKAFGKTGYYSWRIFRGDVIGGFRRYLRRQQGIDPDNPEEDAEYHYYRNGVDQDAIQALFEELGFDCRVVRYFSTQGSFWQYTGEAMGLECTFGIIARKKLSISLQN